MISKRPVVLRAKLLNGGCSVICRIEIAQVMLYTIYGTARAPASRAGEPSDTFNAAGICAAQPAIARVLPMGSGAQVLNAVVRFIFVDMIDFSGHIPVMPEENNAVKHIALAAYGYVAVSTSGSAACNIAYLCVSSHGFAPYERPVAAIREQTMNFG